VNVRRHDRDLRPDGGKPVGIRDDCRSSQAGVPPESTACSRFPPRPPVTDTGKERLHAGERVVITR
jgi:hypothetical protein